MREAVIRDKCDRCGIVIRESANTGQEGEDGEDGKAHLFAVGGTLLTKVKGVNDELISYQDLCSKCEARIISLVEAIMKSGKGRKSKSRGKGKTTRTKNTEGKGSNASSSASAPANP